MKNFLIKVVSFLIIPSICWAFLEAVLPITFFTHRHYEALPFQTGVPHRTDFYPSTKTDMMAEGDLCYHTSKSILKNEFWITDKLGFRNNEFIEKADILFIGDSFTQGCSLGQDEIISNRVKDKLGAGIKVYNMAPCSFSSYERFVNTGIIKKPRLIIYSIVERVVPEMMSDYNASMNSKFKSKVIDFFEIGNMNVYIDKVFKHFSINSIQAWIHDSKGIGVPAKGNPNMFFMKGVSQKHSEQDLYKTAGVVTSYKRYCDSLGIKFIFIPMPDKETVYYELVPFGKQPDYLRKLDSLLGKAGVTTINTLKIYNNYRRINKELLYHFDDSHWNSNATELISKHIAEKMKGENLLFSIK